MEDKDLHYSLKGDRLCNAARKDGSKNINHNIEKDLAYEKINVSRRSKKTIEYVIPSKDIEISWKFLLHGYNIKMSAVLLNKSSNNNVKEKKPKDKEEEKITPLVEELEILTFLIDHWNGKWNVSASAFLFLKPIFYLIQI